jgi:hypothetical protein
MEEQFDKKGDICCDKLSRLLSRFKLLPQVERIPFWFALFTAHYYLKVKNRPETLNNKEVV